MNEIAFFISKAPLPVVYQDACKAMAQCQRLDECKEWTDKAIALASYARQAKDHTLFNMAMRIQARAVDRTGALLKEFDGQGQRTDLQLAEGDHGKLTQRQAADAAGISEHQQLQAVRVNNVPRDEFETAIESENPPTVTELAERGTKKKAPRLRDPYADIWADWVFAIVQLRDLPPCGLAPLAARDELPASRLLADAHAAVENLNLWIRTLEGRDA